jgi:hypothetical protein
VIGCDGGEVEHSAPTDQQRPGQAPVRHDEHAGEPVAEQVDRIMERRGSARRDGGYQDLQRDRDEHRPGCAESELGEAHQVATEQRNRGKEDDHDDHEDHQTTA